jgi:hypothetical protein
LTEENLSSKMSDFMTALDQVKKYREITASMTDFTIIILGTIVAGLLVNICMRLSSLFIIADHGQNIVLYFIYFAIFPAGTVIAVWRVRNRGKSVKTGEWKTPLNEGAGGALKLIDDVEWENVFSSIRYAKVGFFLYSITKILVFWGVAVFGLFVLSILLEWGIHWNNDLVTVLLLALGGVLFFNRNGLRERYEQIGRLDWLLWELRWFESEFRGANFEA